MPLTGELEHLPIVDVIQLIHSTRKSGTLNVYSRKGEGQLVFNNGYIVSATHSSERLKIGKILLESNIITQTELDKALGIQEISGDDRKPLIATLLDHCGLSKDAAFKALETLIEMTVVEMISWARGIFTLDVDDVQVADDYRYLPKQLQTVSLDTQMVLMDALRKFDEKVHAGEIQIQDEAWDDETSQQPQEQAAEENDEILSTNSETEDLVVSEDILGLADMDKIERKKPHVFKGLEVFDPVKIHQQVVSETLTELPERDRQELANYLSKLSTSFAQDDSLQHASTKSQAVILYSGDEFIQHALMTVCKKEGILVFVTANQADLDNLINRALQKYLEPILVFGPPQAEDEGFSKESIFNVRSLKLAQYPQISLIQLASPVDFTFSLQSLNEGVRAVLPLPYYSERPETFADDMINFLDTFQTYIRSCFNEERRQQFAKLRNSLSGLRLLRKAPDISLLVLQFVGELFGRCLTLIIDRDELIAERSIGIFADPDNGPAAPLKKRLPIRRNSKFKEVIQTGELFYGTTEDSSFADLLYPLIGAPNDGHILLLPLVSNERIITITYADFGQGREQQISLDFLEFFTGQAGIAMENALFRKRLKTPAEPEF
jgi:hypothetical protein